MKKTTIDPYKQALPAIYQRIRQVELEIKDKHGVDVMLTVYDRSKKDTIVFAEPATDVVTKLCELWDVPLAFVRERKRTTDRVMMRKIICMLLQKKIKGMPLTAIARLLNMKEHSAVIHAINTGYNMLQTQDEMFMGYYNKAAFLFNETEN